METLTQEAFLVSSIAGSWKLLYTFSTILKLMILPCFPFFE